MEDRYMGDSIERKNIHGFAAMVVIAVLLLRNFLLIHSWQDFIAVTVLPSLPIISTILIWRICLFLSELPHAIDICSGSYLTLLKRTMFFNSASKVVILITIALFPTLFQEFSLNETFLRIVQLYGLSPWLFSLCASFLIFIVCRWEECVTWEALTMKRLDGLDYGSGMAHSFFHGYLKLILPAKGDNNKSLRDRINDYIEKENLTDEHFPVKKLIVFIPRSGYSHPTFSDVPSQKASDRDVEPAERLQDHLRDRAGTRARCYRGGAYRVRVRSGNQVSALYAIAEYATSVLTFREAYSTGSHEAGRLREHKHDVTSNFYRTLRYLIDHDPDCRDLVALIYFDDEDLSTGKDVISLLQEFLLQNCTALP
ncbi:uncharacterized protein LOC117652793 [Thrips palmi]|uniref:Uncharacterized protein LOC117652793 n=1 Tax=Thrips palmi TaxID=161013 RepID=A0A6P9A8D6_THRPL|nr:uncharacterized protein LOC117652793 [Thrips palmi]